MKNLFSQASFRSFIVGVSAVLMFLLISYTFSVTKLNVYPLLISSTLSREQTCSGKKTGLQRTRKRDFYDVDHLFSACRFVLTANAFKK